MIFLNHLNLLTKLAFRNLFRNTRRCLLTILLIACGLTTLLFADAYLKGTYESMIRMSTDTFLGQAQIHQVGFREANDVNLYLKDTDTIIQVLEATEQVQAYAPRILMGGMVSSSANVTSGAVYGVDFEREANLSKLKQAVRQGTYLSGSAGEILIGTELADILEVTLGERIVITASQAAGGDLSQALFRVSGIFHFGDRQMDRDLAFINLTEAQSILGITGLHEIALRFQTIQQADDASLAIWDTLNKNGLETLNWRTLMPQLNGILEMSQVTRWIIAGILFTMVSIGLVNSMFMSIYERHFEFGILLAIGTRPRQLFWQILYEGLLIGLLSAVIGFLLGAAISGYYAANGIDFDGAEFSGISLTDPIFPIIQWLSFTQLSLYIVLITVIACLYPAVHAARLSPTQAMHRAL